MNHAITNLVPYTCLSCRSTFKRPNDKEILLRKCPGCSGQAIRMDPRFRPPKKSGNRQWAKVSFLVRHGFLFQKIYRDLGDGLWCRVRYPETLEQAKDFVLEFKGQALKIIY